MSTGLSAAATAALEREHLSANTVVETMLVIADMVEQGRRLDSSLLTEVIFFLRIFADQCQTAEEDSLLFPALEVKPSSSDLTLLEGLREDHRSLVSLTLELVEVTDNYASGHDLANERLAGVLRRLANIYREHIWKEDQVLLPLAEKILSAEELDALFQAFQRIESGINSEEIANRIGRRAQRCTCRMGEVFF